MINYKLTPSYRVTVDYDCGPQEPPSHLLDTVFYEVASCQNLDIHEGAPEVIGALVKHLKRNGYEAVYHSFAGVCQSDWCDAVVAVKTDEGVALDAAISEWDRWFTNDYYVLTLERRHVWHDAVGDTLETWDEVDSLCGVALENSYDASEVERVARDYFDVEEAA